MLFLHIAFQQNLSYLDENHLDNAHAVEDAGAELAYSACTGPKYIIIININMIGCFYRLLGKIPADY